ncbi:Uncharacterized protein SCF082_LOCUS35722 [Durusdinium trenchii]|uniref:Tyr recombinase domain-containing protein n=1 Tax=Durusdinium trenchii TaxID=1381693 RepID=A0ABP0PAH5_9DINO
MEMSQHFKLNKTILFRDLDYSEEKLEQLELACGKWMDILSTHWEASTVGKQICQDLRFVSSQSDFKDAMRLGATRHPLLGYVVNSIYRSSSLGKVPLGPFLPAPKIGGGFCARPLSTQEAARWLRLLLSGTPGSEKIRCHSLKATLLNWCAKAGLDKEVRAVLGHHSTALHGSDIVYLRELQVRPLRKLQMLLKSIRIGLNLEDIASQGTLLAATPGATTPRPNVFTPPLPVPARGDQVHKPAEEQVVEQAVELVNVEEENESIKEEIENITNLEAFACDLSLFGEEAVRQGSVYYKHVKTSRVHHVRVGKEATNCGKKLNENFKELEPVIYIRLPKCLICFPSAEGRVRTREDAIARFDAALKRARV